MADQNFKFNGTIVFSNEELRKIIQYLGNKDKYTNDDLRKLAGVNLSSVIKELGSELQTKIMNSMSRKFISDLNKHEIFKNKFSDLLIGKQNRIINIIDKDTKETISDSIRERTLLPKENVTERTTGNYSVPIGTRLWHASEIKTFNKNNIVLGTQVTNRQINKINRMNQLNIPGVNNINLQEDTFIYLTSDKHLAIQSIGGCSNLLYNPFQKELFVHEFIVKSEINNIIVIDRNDLQDFNKLTMIRKQTCNSNTGNSGASNGFLYFINRPDFSRLSGQDISQVESESIIENAVLDSDVITKGQGLGHAIIEIGLCNPNNYLEYVGSYRCDSIRRISEKYDFNNSTDYKAKNDPLENTSFRSDVGLTRSEVSSLISSE